MPGEMNLKPEPYYPDGKPGCFERGMEFQDFVCTILAREHIILQNLASKKYQIETGENLQGFEIKLDRRCTDTGRLSIEIAEKTRAEQVDWFPSGIYRDDNSWLYIQGNGQILFIFAKNWLRRWHKHYGGECTPTPTIKAFYIQFEVAKEHAIKWFDLGVRAPGVGKDGG